MDLTARPAHAQSRPAGPPRQNLSEERLQALAADLKQAFARIGRRRF
ncbi:MAG TPA: hypothetical protein VGM25_14470 [Caulobacteraceae bacterium]|jgi:hypothetical protein